MLKILCKTLPGTPEWEHHLEDLYCLLDAAKKINKLDLIYELRYLIFTHLWRATIEMRD